MLIRTRQASEPRPSEITHERIYAERREFMRRAACYSAVGASGLLFAGCGEAGEPGASSAQAKREPAHAPAATGGDWRQRVRQPADGPFGTTEPKTPYRDVTTYNNFYEFGTGKDDPHRAARNFETQPWKVQVAGEVSKPGTYDLDDLLRPHAFEERVYRLRCVEAWSMVVPWVGFPLGDLIRRFEPTGNAKYVAFTTLHDPDRMPGQAARFSTIRWPYREGLRMDEAMHPLTILAVGLYDRLLPPQNGAPLRLVVPWKYGFKSIKSIVRIELTEQMPATSWSLSAPHEYGFFANVNPAVDHPRWSQKRERRLPGSLFSPNWMETQPFNGYAEEVAGLYRGMDLRKFI